MDQEKKVDDVIEEEIPLPEEENAPLTTEEIEEAKDKKIKNLISLAILLAGLFVGSLFVDIVQLVKGAGFSERALSTADVFSAGGKSWVAYPDPIVTVQILNDDTCGDACKPDEALVGLKRVMPTMLTQKVDVNSETGKELAAKFSVKSVPAFIFSKELENVDLFAQAQSLFTKVDNQYLLDTAKVGLPVGKYITAPAMGDKDIKIGADNAIVKVALFSNFSNPADAKFYTEVIAPMIKDYGDRIQVVFKNYFPQTATQAQSAALASECANAQGKFIPFAEKLYTNSATWSKAKDATPTLKMYAAQLGLNTGDFNKCLDSKQFQDQVTQSLNDGRNFGIAATPSMFIGSELQAATVKYDDVKKALDTQLSN